MPVNLLSFTAEASADDIRLDWATSAEIEFSHFILELSQNAHFLPIARVSGEGRNGLGATYTYNHKASYNGSYLFRLRQIDFDGTEVLSQTVHVEISGITGISVFPNPATWQFWIKGPVDSGELQIYSLAGQHMMTTAVPDETGFMINCRDWPRGVYLLLAGGKQKRIIIQ